MSATPLLQVHDLHFAYPGRPLWQGWSHAWPRGVALVCGGDGAGKTTLLRLLAGQERAPRGRLVLAGVDLAADAAAYRRQVFWMDPRAPELPPEEGLTPRRWLQGLAPAHAQWSAAALQTHVQGWALEPHLDKPFFALSTGTQRKIFMAAGLASGAPLVLIDEPVGGLDRPSMLYLSHALQARQLSGATGLVLVAHYETLPGVHWDGVLDLPG
jgi:ABC-type multidrug transport system ATPase subunit